MGKTPYTHKRTQTNISSGLTTASLSFKPTPKAQEILDSLYEVGEWMSRSALAAQLSKNALNKWDVVLLGKLADAGFIETRQIPHHGPIGYEWQYRAASSHQL